MELYYLMSITDRDRAEDMAALYRDAGLNLVTTMLAGARQHPSSWRCTACPGRKRPSPALWWEPTA